MQAWQADGDWRAFDTARFEAFEAGRKARKRSSAARWLAAHPAPAVSVEQLLMEVYLLGQRSKPPVTH